MEPMRPRQMFLAIVTPLAFYWWISMQMWTDLFPPNMAHQGPRRRRRAPEVTP